MLNLNNPKPIFAVLFITVLAFLERTVFDLGPNVELVTLAMIASGWYLSVKSSLKFTLLLLIATDLVIGNTRIFVFTWSGFILPLLVLRQFKHHALQLPAAVSGTFFGLLSNLFFFFWTNFGVWLLDSWGMYPNTLTGLLQSYVAGLPFLRLQLASTLLFIPSGFLAIQLIPNLIVQTRALLVRTRLI